MIKRSLLLMLLLPLVAEAANIDTVIHKHLGEKYRRATAEDVHRPHGKRELREYISYLQRNLREVSGGSQLKYYKLNFDGDRSFDYVAVVSNPRKKKNILFVANENKVLYQEDFPSHLSYLEPLNYGKFPTIVPTKKGKKKIDSPAIRLVSFEDESYIFYMDRTSKQWKKEALAY